MNKDVEKNLRGQIRKLRKRVKRLENALWSCDMEQKSWGFIIDDLAEKVFTGDKEGLVLLYKRYVHKRAKMEHPELYREIYGERHDIDQSWQSAQDSAASTVEGGNDEQ